MNSFYRRLPPRLCRSRLPREATDRQSPWPFVQRRRRHGPPAQPPRPGRRATFDARVCSERRGAANRADVLAATIEAKLLPSKKLRMKGLEPSRGCPHWHLKPARLPIPPHPLRVVYPYTPKVRPAARVGILRRRLQQVNPNSARNLLTCLANASVACPLSSPITLCPRDPGLHPMVT